MHVPRFIVKYMNGNRKIQRVLEPLESESVFINLRIELVVTFFCIFILHLVVYGRRPRYLYLTFALDLVCRTALVDHVQKKSSDYLSE